MKSTRSVFTIVAATTFLTCLAAAVLAQQPNQISASQSVWSGVYTESQAARGQTAYGRSCEKCHSLAPDGVPRQFRGEAFWADWGEDSLGSLFSFVRSSMPNDAPASLSAETYADIVAFLLRSNDVPPGTQELTATTVSSVRLNKRESDGQLPEGAFVSASGCLAKTAGGWVITHAPAPERSRTADAREAAVAAVRPLGSSTFRLLFVMSPLDPIHGHRVVVRGLLVGQPSDAINVTTVQSVAPDCS